MAALGALIGSAIFISGLPSRLPEEQVAVARAAHQEWAQRHNADVVRGRPSSAGARPEVETHTRGLPVVITLGFLIAAISAVAFIQSFV
ncbi:hypothetical protein [Azospirillum sp.]|uniref:hypothetical protein n=1 Tax=Azospirillum sp. TaxID=34012 RepID=UPI003D7360BF